MSTRITMPQLGESVSEGTVGRWLKQEGETIKRDEPLVEIITDKVTAEYPSPVTGRVVKILVKEDETVKVGAEIAEIEETGGASSGGGSTARASAPTSAGSPGGAGNGAAPSSGAPVHGMGATSAAPMAPSAPSASSATATLERVSPLARRMAQEHQIDLTQVQGTGENGRIRKEDIVAHLAQQTQPQAAAASATQPAQPAQPAQPTQPAQSTRQAAPAAPVAQMAGDQVINPSPARRLIAEHMVRSKQT